MSKTIDEQHLNDYVDGLLSEREASEVERVLQTSVQARRTVEFLKSLRRQCADLPASIEPERDLWPEIRRRMAPVPLTSVDGIARRSGSGPASSAWWPTLSPSQWATLAAAAMLLMVMSSAITAWLVGTPAMDAALRSPAAESTPVTTAAMGGKAPIGAEYAIEIERLLSMLYENRDLLDVETVSTIETNLRVIDRAIRNAREALAEDPQNSALTRRLASNYRHKLQLLQRANRIIELS